MFKGFLTEIKNSILSNPFKLIRWLGVLILPLVYSFIYIFAFFNPFNSTNNLDLRIYASSQDSYATQVVQKLQKEESKVEIGHLEVKVKFNSYNPNSIYNNESDINTTKAFGTVVIHNGFDTRIDNAIKSVHTQGQNVKLPDIFKFINTLGDQSKDNPLIDFYVNFQKNYIIGLGLDVSSGLQPVYVKFIDALVEVGKNSSDPIVNDFFSRAPSLNNLSYGELNKEFSLINQHSEMSEHSKYGFGLAPFFISIGIWVGAMGATLTFHSKVYDKRKKGTATYMGKLLAVWLTMILQMVLLFIPLYFIGFKDLGANYWWYFISSILIGLTLIPIVVSIRYMIPNKTLGILLVLIFLVIQMVSSSGLFPVESQNILFSILHPLMPFTYSVNMFREASYHTNWAKLFFAWTILIIFATFFTTMGIYFYSKRKKDYLNQNDNVSKGVKNV